MDYLPWEFLGTAIYMFVRLYTVNPYLVGASLTTLMIIFQAGHRGSFNPALDVATLFADRGKRWILVKHWVAQLAGAIVAGLSYKAIMG